MEPITGRAGASVSTMLTQVSPLAPAVGPSRETVTVKPADRVLASSTYSLTASLSPLARAVGTGVLTQL